jgi:hypothetical protein
LEDIYKSLGDYDWMKQAIGSSALITFVFASLYMTDLSGIVVKNLFELFSLPLCQINKFLMPQMTSTSNFLGFC